MQEGIKKHFFGLKIILSIILVATTVSIVAAFFHDAAEGNSSTSETNPKAVIIDQLYDDIPNNRFHEIAIDLFAKAGYEVDVFTTKDITIDFYKQLPSKNYKFVLIRSHGAADENDNDSVTLFTGERYDNEKYISEQLFGQVKKGAPLEEVDYIVNNADAQWVMVNDTYTLSVPAKTFVSSKDEYFLITPTFIDSNMKGKFSKTIFLLGGCSTMHTDTMAKSLVKRGASTVIGWDDRIGSGENDYAMLMLLDKLFVMNMELDDAVESLMEQIPLERMSYQARMAIYSDQI